jgi:Skp family chaperone for outer membrane proteins
MWRNKKIILVALLVIVVAATTAAVAFAQTNSISTTDQSQTPESRDAALLAKVSAMYQEKTGVAIDTTALKEAFAQAQSDMRNEAVNTRLQNLVSEGKLTQEQADQYKQWWQARPDTPLAEPLEKGFGSGMMGEGRGSHGPGPCW